VGAGEPQIFEQLEQAGLKVGAISAMNAENRLKTLHTSFLILGRRHHQIPHGGVVYLVKLYHRL
jgi:hypothetical protein